MNGEEYSDSTAVQGRLEPSYRREAIGYRELLFRQILRCQDAFYMNDSGLIENNVNLLEDMLNPYTDAAYDDD